MKNRSELLDFFAQYPKYNRYVTNQTFEEIYDWLGKPWQVYEMITSCKNNRPGIEGVARQLETTFGNRTDINIKEDFVKQMVGTAVKHILGYFGYRTTIQKTFLKDSAHWFKSGMHYTYDENAQKTKKLQWEPIIIDSLTTFEEVWERIEAHEGSEFRQKRGMVFTYTVKGSVIAPNTTNYLVPKSQFEKAWNRIPINGPGEIIDLIAPSYIYAIITDVRICNPTIGE